MIRVSCPSCRATFKTENKAAGRTTACPKCSGPIAIPILQSVDDKPNTGVLKALWSVCALWSLLVFVLGVALIAFKAKSAIQEAAIAAMICMNVVCMYVTMRSLDFIQRLGKSSRREMVAVGIAVVMTSLVFMLVAHVSLKDIGDNRKHFPDIETPK